MRIADQLRGASRLAIAATTGVTDIVEAMHAEIGRVPLTGLVYRSVRGVTRLVGSGLDLSLHALTPLLGQADTRRADALIAALNGVLGDYLEDTANPLAIAMSLHPLAGDEGQPALVFLHGLCMNEVQWLRAAGEGSARFPAELAALGYRALGLRYNSGRAVGRNGAELAALLEDVPGPLTLLGHSMGGLVARSAIAQAQAQGLRWPARLRGLVTLGTPHLGAPLERGGQQVQQLLAASAYSRPLALLAARRSAGIRDLRYGRLLETDTGRVKAVTVPLPLPAGVACYAVAAKKTKSADSAPTHWQGDGLVPVASALGHHRLIARRLAFTDTAVFPGLGHLGLQTDAAVLAQLKQWLSPA